ncbi:unnamed protein product [Hydatigera taeniaeformis]|uniref:C2H2-type domain-containing protein n=1 Tax=Hydatigena taeniaeformis TaxID=6205 RepID=A0A0R3X7A2_HYDTA|nr:unnamed protein product [Hydatigera taeniaeformis]
MDQDDGSEPEICAQILELENSEMASGVLSSSQYLNLLCLYLRTDNLMAARFLWKRIPDDCKTDEPHLKSVWNLTVLLLRRRNCEFLSSCQEFLRVTDVSPSIQSHLSTVYQRIQSSTVDLIKSAFSCISVEKLCSMLSLSQDEAVGFLENWTPSSDGLFLIEPSIPHLRTEALPEQAVLNTSSGGCSTAVETLRLQCPQCPFHTTSSVTLRQHAWTNHLDGNQTFQSRFYTCSRCTAATTDLSSLRDHFAQAHNMHEPDVRVVVTWITLTRGAVPQTDARTPTPSPPSPAVAIEASDDNALMVVEDCGTTEVSPVSPPFAESSHDQSTVAPPPPPAAESQDWSQLISRMDKKFSCLLCIASSPSVYFYNGRTEVVFHVVTRHLLRKEIEDDLAHHRKLTNKIKQRIGVLFVDGMHIRSGVHYKDAERVEAALFHSVELHLRWKAVPGADTSLPPQNMFTCSGCQAVFHNEQMAVNHINQELRAQLPDFMRARSCPWSLSARDEWVWCVPDLQSSPTTQQQHSLPLSQTALSPTAPSPPPHDSSTTLLTSETRLPKSLLFASINNTAASPSSSASRRL